MVLANQGDEVQSTILGVDEFLLLEAEFGLECCDAAVEGDYVVHAGLRWHLALEVEAVGGWCGNRRESGGHERERYNALHVCCKSISASDVGYRSI